jgi:hypothetical protein
VIGGILSHTMPDLQIREAQPGDKEDLALLDNEASQRAHSALGFEVVDRCVHFRKQI